MQSGKRRFSPGLWPTLATLCIFPLLLMLGFWQLDRADQKTALYQRYLQRGNAEAVTTLGGNMPAGDLVWRKASLAGHFSKSPGFLLDNQVLKGVVGYQVYAVFVLDNNNSVLVNRGWIPAGNKRQQIPAITVPAGTMKINGTIKPPPKTGWLLAENTDEALPEGVFRLQHINPEDLNSRYHLQVLPYIVRLDKGSMASYVCDWPRPGSGREKHLGYAFQWFAMAITLLIVFVAVNLKKQADEA